ncbi:MULTISPECIES: efflux RND transporter periplasmic adaptor subunit [unclassified Novosphingobium]|uniref:efflux RND transporter periplasmic adaptor subunit n=1 Tax=Novosphingobium TaxID=165696 RepID=UPI0017979817|nr:MULTISPECIES: HlyD family efflux transporter periplasmic adaptor subunit [unclassified Novosphingobium]NMN03214.1 RND family efflux transporter MFP subunit [Novosphingobium sp. SG919]NMN86796.1 RND family efflux transporter MFP subunit [Novosphingobium sp. SG916]
MASRAQEMLRFPTLASLRPPRIAVALGWMIGIAIPLVVLGALLIPWVQTAPGTGQVVALNPADRVQQVTALVPGRVERWYVTDGQSVKAGDPIARVVDNDPGLLERLAAERAQVLAQIVASEQAMAVARIDVGRSAQLLADGLAARRDFENAQIKVAEHGAKLAEARAKLSRVDIARTRQSAQLVRAPRDGRIQALNTAAGATLVSAGDWLASLAPERPVRVVELMVDGRDVALVRRGQGVRLHFEGWPAIQFSGWPSVAQGMFDGRVRSIDPSAQANGLFRVLVEPMPGKPAWPEDHFTRLGSRVRGWIQMETVSVGYELWRQLNDFPLEFQRPVETGPRKGAGKGLADKDAAKAKSAKAGDYAGGKDGGEEEK